MMRNRISVALVLAVFLLVNGCGGGGGGGGSSKPAPGFGGLWSGTLAVDGSIPEDVVGISTADGRFQFLLPEIGLQMSGTATVVGMDVSGSGFAYTTIPGDTFPGGVTKTGFSFTGNLAPGSTFTGDWQIDTGDFGSFALEYDIDHERNAALDLVNDMWVQYDDFLNPLITFVIDSDGIFSGSSAVCESNGQISVPDTNFNVYGWDVTVSGAGCPIAGVYTGLATLGDLDATNDALVVLATNDVRALFLPLQRQ